MCAGSAQADKKFLAVWQPGQGEFQWRTGMRAADVKAADDQFFKRGLRIAAIDAFKYSDFPEKISYTVLWRPGSGGQWWRVGMDLDEFKAEDKKRFNQGYRLAELDVQSGSISAVWRPGSGEQHWHVGVSSGTLDNLEESYRKQGLRMVMMKQHGSHDFAAVWRPGSGEERFQYGLSAAAFKDKDAEYFARGLRLVSVDSYDGRWNAVWHHGTGAQWVNWGMSLDKIKAENKEHADEGLRPTVIRAKSYNSAERGGSGNAARESCAVQATITNDFCFNLEGSVSTILLPGSFVVTACGASQQAARDAAKAQMERGFVCLTTKQEKKPGCCTYKFE
jgi:hypothetical protein